MIRIFLERLIEWDWPDAPGRNPILHGDIPPRPEPLPKFLTDQTPPSSWPPPERTASRATGSSPRCSPAPACAPANSATSPLTPSPRSVTPTGSACRSASSATTGSSPCTPTSSTLLAEWTATNADHIRAQGRLLADGHVPIYRRTVHRIVARIGINAGIGPVHPHQLRHTLATQAINRGMRLEAIAALLGHRSLEMTLVYARIADRVVADEYASVCEQIDALYNTAATPGALPAEIETAAMTQLRQQAHARMLGNGLCTRPAELDCRMETACETCAYFKTGPEFVPVLLRQRDHARDHHQPERAALFDQLLDRATEATP